MLNAGTLLDRKTGVIKGYRAKYEWVPALVAGQTYEPEYLAATHDELDPAALLAQKVDCPASTGGVGMATDTVVNYQALKTTTYNVKTLVTVTNDENLNDTNTEYIKYPAPDNTFRAVGGEKQTSTP